MQKPKKDRVIIGMDGGIDSAVTALLLKKQGHECIGVNISFLERLTAEDEEFEKQFQAKLTPEGNLPDNLVEDDEAKENFERFTQISWVRKNQEIFAPWASSSEEQIRDICRLIGIPFYVTNASSAFEESVISKIVEARVGGVWINPSIERARLIYETLYSKCEVLKADRIATGHYCKILIDHNSYSFAAPNDLERNDCHLLSKVDLDILAKLILPLADLKSNEVDKIGQLVDSKTLSRAQVEQKKAERKRTYKSEGIRDLIPRFVSRNFIKEGSVFNYFDNSEIGAHEGQHHFYLGQSQYKLKDSKPRLPDSRVIAYYMSSGLVYVNKSKELFFERIVANHFVNFDVVDTSKPLECYCVLASNNKSFKGSLYILNNENIYFDLEDKVPGIVFRGDTVVFYLKNTPGAKAIGHARVYQSGQFFEGGFYQFPLKKSEKEELEESQSKAKKRELGF